MVDIFKYLKKIGDSVVLPDKSLARASGGVVGDPGFLKKYIVYDDRTGQELNHFWSKSSALKYDREYNGTNGEILDEDSVKFARYQKKWNKHNKLHGN